MFPFEHRVALGDRLYGCDDCQEVCPPNQRAGRRPVAYATPAATIVVDVLDLLDASDDELLARHGRWYIPRREARYLRRNALVVLGNTGRGDDPRVLAALRAALAGTDPLLRAHAVWAAARLGAAHLLAEVTQDADPLVAEELRRAPKVPSRAPS